jgi:hypothetical protein
MKHFLLFALILSASTIVAQNRTSSVLLSEGFESGVMPSSWTVLDEDNDNEKWEMHPSTWTDSHTGSYAVASYSWFNGSVLTPDNWLITPAIELGTNGILQYYVKAVRDTYAQEHYQVKISTSGTVPSDFSEVLIDETLPEGNNTWLQREADLSSYANQTVHIAFVHNQSTDLFAIKIDDITVEADTSSVEILSLKKQVSRIYPNPLKNSYLNIKSEEQIFQIKIYDIIGNCIFDNRNIKDNSISLNLDLKSGQYICQIHTNVGLENLKLLVE